MSTTLLIIFLAFIGIQCIYIILFLIAFLKYKIPSKTSHEAVSVIIAARNELHNLKVLLPELYAQNHSNYEIIIVNDQSIDETYDFLKNEIKANGMLKVVTIDNNPSHIDRKKYAITLGVRAAKNDLLLFTDADCLPHSDRWIESMTSNAQDKQFVLGFSNYIKEKGFLNYLIRYETLFTAIQYIGMALLGKPYMGVGRNLVYRKNLFLKNKGFNGFMNLVGGDDDLFVNKYASNKSTAIVVGGDSNTLSYPKKTFKTYFRQKIRHTSVGKHYKPLDKLNLALFSLSYIMSWLLLPLVLIYSELYIVIGSFLFRMLLSHLLIILSTKRLNITLNAWGLIFIEFSYVIFYSFLSLRVLFTKKITWS